jgi:hypothetical protein
MVEMASPHHHRRASLLSVLVRLVISLFALAISLTLVAQHITLSLELLLIGNHHAEGESSYPDGRREARLGPAHTERIRNNMNREPCIVCHQSHTAWVCDNVKNTPPLDAWISTNITTDLVKYAPKLVAKLQKQAAGPAQSNTTKSSEPTSMQATSDDNVAKLGSTLAATGLADTDDVGDGSATTSQTGEMDLGEPYVEESTELDKDRPYKSFRKYVDRTKKQSELLEQNFALRINHAQTSSSIWTNHYEIQLDPMYPLYEYRIMSPNPCYRPQIELLRRTRPFLSLTASPV